MFSSMSVGWFVSRITKKTTKRFSTKLGLKMGLDPEWTPVPLCVYLGISFLTFITLRERALFQHECMDLDE